MKHLKKLFYSFVISLSLILVSPISFLGQPTNIIVSVQAKVKSVYITKTGKKYHIKKCGNGKYTKTTLTKAKASGLKPCTKCYGK